MPKFSIHSVLLKGKAKSFPQKWKKDGKSAVSVIQNAYSSVRRHHKGDKKGQYVITLSNGEKLSRYHCKCTKYSKKELNQLKKQFKDRPVPKYKVDCKYLKKTSKSKSKMKSQKGAGKDELLRKSFEAVKYENRLRMRLIRDKLIRKIVMEDIPMKQIDTVMRVALKVLDGVLNEKLFKTKQGHRILHGLVGISGLDEVIGDIVALQRGGTGPGRRNQQLVATPTTQQDFKDLQVLDLVAKKYVYDIQKSDRLAQKGDELEEKIIEEFRKGTKENKSLFKELLQAQATKCKNTENELFWHDTIDRTGTAVCSGAALYTVHGFGVLLNNILEGAVSVMNVLGVLFAHMKNMLPIVKYYTGSSVCPQGWDKWIEQSTGEVEDGWAEWMGLVEAAEKNECVGLDTSFLFGGGVSKMMVGVLSLLFIIGTCFTYRAIRIARGRTNFSDNRGLLADMGFKLTIPLQVFFVRESKKIMEQREFVRKTKGQKTLHYDTDGSPYAIGVDERTFTIKNLKKDSITQFLTDSLQETRKRLQDHEKETRDLTQQLLLSNKKEQ